MYVATQTGCDVSVAKHPHSDRNNTERVSGITDYRDRVHNVLQSINLSLCLYFCRLPAESTNRSYKVMICS